MGDRQSGKEDEAKNAKHFELELWVTARGQGTEGGVRLTGEEGWCSAWLRVPNNKGSTVTGSDDLGGQGKGNKKKYTFGIFTFFFFLPLYTVSLNISLHVHTSLSSKASGHQNTHFFLTRIHNPSHQHWCTRLCKNFSVTLCF